MDPNYFRSLEQAAVQFIRACETMCNAGVTDSDGNQVDVLPNIDGPSSSPAPDCPSFGLPPLLVKQEAPPEPTEQPHPADQLNPEDDAESQITIVDPLALLSSCSSNGNGEWVAAPGNNRMSYSREFKLMVIDYYHRNGQNKYRTCKEFHITKSMLKGWLSRIDKIRESRPGSLKSGRTGRRPDIEKRLFAMYCKRLETGLKVSNRWLRERARELAGDVNAVCQFSDRWLRNFKKRFHIDLQRGNMDSSHSNSDDPMDADKSFPDTDSITDPTELDVGLRNEVVAEIVNQTEQLPIQAFYEKFPLLSKKDTPVGTGKRGRKAQFPDVERVLYQRFISRMNDGERISNRWLQDQARELAAEMYAGAEDTVKSSRCLFSERWLANFKKRYNISLKNKTVTTFKQEEQMEDNIVELDHSSPPCEEIDVNTVLTAWLMNQTDIPPLSSPGNSKS
ncbi:centromere binding protein B, DNA binding protein [Ostertagia ostertagi]